MASGAAISTTPGCAVDLHRDVKTVPRLSSMHRVRVAPQRHERHRHLGSLHPARRTERARVGSVARQLGRI